MFPRAVDRARARDDDHVAGGWAGCAADGRDEVEPFPPAQDFRAFGREAFDDPLLGITPRIVDVFDLADGGEAVIAQADAVTAGEEEPACAVFADGVAGIDVARQVEVDGFRPWAFGPFGVDDVDRALLREARGDEEEVAAVVLGEFGRPDGADVGVQRGGERRPVHEVAALPDDEARIGFE